VGQSGVHLPPQVATGYTPAAMDEDLKQRAAARRARTTITKRRLGEEDEDGVIRGEAAVSLVYQLTMTSWTLSGRPVPGLARHELPYRFLPGRRT